MLSLPARYSILTFIYAIILRVAIVGPLARKPLPLQLIVSIFYRVLLLNRQQLMEKGTRAHCDI